MITRFRIEGEANSRQDVIDELSLVSSRIIALLSQFEGEWECTHDVTTKTDVGYSGRMVLKFELEDDKDAQ